MHNISSNFRKFFGICKKFFEQEVDKRGNLQFYPAPTKMSDIEIISLSCCMEALGVDSENFLWGKLRTDYVREFPNLIDRTRFNRRRRRLSGHIERVQQFVADQLEGLSSHMIIDSVRLP